MCTYWVFLHIFAVLLMCDYGMFSKPSSHSTKVTPSTARPESTTHNANQNPSPERKNGSEGIMLLSLSLFLFFMLIFLFGILYIRRKKARMISSLYSRPHTKNWTETRTDSDVNVNSLYRALTQLKKIQETLNEKLSQTGLKIVQKFAVDVTLDPDTANPYLILSDDGKQVRHVGIMQNYPKNPKRFDKFLCVLAKEGFSSGRFYYEVQVKGKTDWSLGVARESINRKGTIRPEDGVWALALVNKNQYVVSDNPMVIFPLRVRPAKVGVFVDYEEGLVSFYDVESRSHIYSFTDQNFTEKLHPLFGSGRNDKGKNSNPLIITLVR